MKKLKLQYPFSANGSEIGEVEISRPITVMDLIVVGGALDDDETYFRASANALGIAPKDFESVDFEDLEAINEALDDLAQAASALPAGFSLRRPTGRDVMDVKKDHTAKNLARVISRLADKKEEEIAALNASQFAELVSKVSAFIGRREKK